MGNIGFVDTGIPGTGSTIQSLYAGPGYTISNKYVIWNAAQSSTAIWTAAASKRWHITDLIISASTSCDVTLIDDTSTLTTLYFDNRGGAVSNFCTPIQATGTTTSLRVTTTASTCSMLLTGYEA